MFRALLLSVMLLSMARCARFNPCGAMPPGTGTVPVQTFTSVEGRFRIGLPELVAKSSANAETRKENDKSFRWVVINRGQFEVRYVDGDRELEAPEASEAVITNFRELLRSTKPGEFEVDSVIRLRGHPGRELRMRDEHGVQIHRIYLVGKRMYVVAAFVPYKLECGFDDVVKTLDSFEVIEENARRVSLL